MLVLSRFEPARFFGQPVRGLAVLSFCRRFRARIAFAPFFLSFDPAYASN